MTDFTIEQIDSNLLDFDTENPRLVEDTDHERDDASIINFLASGYDLKEIIESVLANNYIGYEPIIILPKGDRYTVIEGNRRLAAIKLFKDTHLAKEAKITLPNDIPESVLRSIDKIPSITVNTHDEAQAFIGFKHINGANKWNSFAKAKYVTEWYLNGVSIEEIASKVGDNNQTVRDLISGMLVLQQAEAQEIFQVSDKSKPGPFGFSHLYTALNRSEYKEFLDLEQNWNKNPTRTPVKTEKLPQLKQILQLIYGSKKDSVQSVIKSQNPDLKHLGEVIAHPIALMKLEKTGELEIALDETHPKDSVFESSLIDASIALEKSLKTVTSYKGTNPRLVEIAGDIVSNAQLIHSVVQKKFNE